ncbi:MAG: PEP-utilizing enzyme, partial [Promicromonosporaceae bacterium]|nr:PEP-utilizing enzyme [Promicromonosporaceae bacterium]
MKTLRGVAVSPGRVAGPVVAMPAPLPEPPLKRLPKDADLEDFAQAVRVAARRVADDLDERAEHATGTAADLLLVTAAMASDPTLATEAARRVVEDRETPQRAVWDAAQAIVEQIEDMGGPLAERARDVRDVRDRIIAVLSGQRPPGVPTPGQPFVLIAGDLAPADAAMLDATNCLAIVTESGGPTSPTPIMARPPGIPALGGAAGLRQPSAGDVGGAGGRPGAGRLFFSIFCGSFFGGFPAAGQKKRGGLEGRWVLGRRGGSFGGGGGGGGGRCFSRGDLW